MSLRVLIMPKYLLSQVMYNLNYNYLLSSKTSNSGLCVGFGGGNREAVYSYWMNKNIFNPEDEQGIVDHMNDDHSSSLVHYCHLLGMFHITEKDNVVMTGIDQNGFDLEVNGENIRYELEKPMKDPREVRKVLVTLTRKVLPDKKI